jgi:hypothetical protein
VWRNQFYSVYTAFSPHLVPVVRNLRGNPPAMIRILFLAANPNDQLRLQSRRELDQLCHALDAAPHGRRFALIQEFAVAADQLQELLVRHQPQMVHFSGHGAAEGLLFEAADGRSQRVAPATLRDLFAGFRRMVRCVVLNA